MNFLLSLAERFTGAGEPDGISGIVEYRTEVFSAAHVREIIDQLEEILWSTTADPTQVVSDCQHTTHETT